MIADPLPGPRAERRRAEAVQIHSAERERAQQRFRRPAWGFSRNVVSSGGPAPRGPV